MDFEKIYRTYFNDVFRYIHRLSSNEHIPKSFLIAQTVVMNMFCRKIQKLENGPDQTSIFPYGKAIHFVCVENMLYFAPIVLSRIQHKRLRLSGWSLFL